METIRSVVKNSFGQLTMNGTIGNRFENNRTVAGLLASAQKPQMATDIVNGTAVRFFSVNYSLVEGSHVVRD